MQGIIDYEGYCLQMKLFQPWQIDDIRTFFVYVLRDDQSCLGFDDFSNFIVSLLGPGHLLDQGGLREFFKQFDFNGDGHLDWNEYLTQFVSGLQQNQYMKVLKMLPTIQLKKRYLSLLQIENLIQPFQQGNNYQLNYIQQQLLAIEKQVPSIRHIKGCYIIFSQEIPIVDTLLPLPAQVSFQSIYNALQNQTQQLSVVQQLNELLLLLIQQRAPHQISYIGAYFKELVHHLTNDQFMEPIFQILVNDPENSELLLATLQYITQLLFALNVLNLKSESFNNLLSLVIFHINSEQIAIKYQSLLCIGHLIVFRPMTIDECVRFDAANSIMNMHGLMDDKQLLFYHSWVLSCLAGRYQTSALEQFIHRMNHQEFGDKSKEWVVGIVAYTKNILSHFSLYDDDPLTVQIIVNTLATNSHLLCTPNSHQHLWDLMLQSIQSKDQIVNTTIRHQILLNINKLFSLPCKVGFLNSAVQVYLLQNGVIQSLLYQCASQEPIIREYAIKVTFKTLSQKCHNLVTRYFDETQSAPLFLELTIQLFTQITSKLFSEGFIQIKLLLMKALMALSTQNGYIFQTLCNDQLYFFQLMQLMDVAHKSNELQLAIFSNKTKCYELQIDNTIWTLAGMFLDQYLKHFHNIFNSPSISEQQFTQVIQLMPDQRVIEYIQEFLDYIFINMKSMRPLFIKKSLKDVYQNVLNCLFIVGQFQTQLLEFCKRLNTTVLVINKIEKQLSQCLKTYETFVQKSSELENFLVLMSSQASKDGNVITVYINQYQSNPFCKIVLTKGLTLLDFEKQIENGLNTSNPLIYLVVNQSDPQKSLLDQTIIGHHTFEKFKNYALQLVETQVGGQLIPQEIIAVDIFKIKYIDEFTMKRLFQIMMHGSKYFELTNMKKNSILWYLDNNNINFGDEKAIIQILSQETQLNYLQMENLHRSLVNFLQKRGLVLNSFLIGATEFIDFLADMGVPFSIGKTLQNFLSKQGLNNPVDYRDVVCFLACFSGNSSETLILKLIFLAYMDQQNGLFGQTAIENYLRDMIAIQQAPSSEPQIKQWSQDLMQEVDINRDGKISFFEFHSLLRNPQYKTRLFDPLQKTLCQLTQEKQPQGYFYGRQQQSNYGNYTGFMPSLNRQYGSSSNLFYRD